MHPLQEALDDPLDDSILPHPTQTADAVARFTIPRFPALAGIQVLRQAVREAVDLRRGVVVTAPIGYGKTEGAHAARAFFLEQERQLALEKRSHVVRRVVYVHLRTARTYRKLLLNLLRKATPGRPVRERINGSPVDDDDLRKLLYLKYRQQNVAALIVDEGSRLSDAGLLLARDLIAESDEDEHRTVDDSGVPSTAAVGVGVVVVGLPGLERRVLETGEAMGSGRWPLHRIVPPLAAEQIPALYEAIFPAFAAHVTAMGRRDWHEFIQSHVVRGEQLTPRFVTTHCRHYFASLVDTVDARVAERREAPFERALFLRTLRDVRWDSAGRMPAPATTETAALRAVDD